MIPGGQLMVILAPAAVLMGLLLAEMAVKWAGGTLR